MYSTESGDCSAFLSNYDSKSAATVLFNNMHYNLPPWSVSILPDCRNAVFNTAKVRKMFDTISSRLKRKRPFNIVLITETHYFRLEYKHLKCKCYRQILRCSRGRVLMKMFLLWMIAPHSLFLVFWSK